MANVGADEFGFRAEATQFGDQLLAGVIAAAGNDEAGAFLREGQCGGAADAGKRASDQNNWMAHVTSPLNGAICLVGLSASSHPERACCRIGALWPAVEGDVERAGVQEKDFVRSKPYF